MALQKLDDGIKECLSEIIEEAGERIRAIESGEDDVFPAEYETEYPEYWRGRLHVASDLLMRF